MIRRWLLVTLSVLSIASGVAALQSPTMVAAQGNTQTENEICQGVGVASRSGACGNASGTISRLFRSAANVISAIIGVVAVFMIMFAGYRYLTSAGDSAKIASAKNTLIFAIVGLVVVALAQFIVQFVIDSAT